MIFIPLEGYGNDFRRPFCHMYVVDDGHVYRLLGPSRSHWSHVGRIFFSEFYIIISICRECSGTYLEGIFMWNFAIHSRYILLAI